MDTNRRPPETPSSLTANGGATGGSRAARAGWRLLLGATFLLLPVFGLNALSLSTIDAHAGILWLGSAGDGQVIAPSPLLNDWGISLPVNFSSTISVVPEVDLFGTQYQLLGSRAVPTEIEYRSSVWLLDVLFDPAVRFQFHPSKRFTWGLSVGPALIFHVPTVSWDLTSQQISQITGYFYAKERFIYPETGAFLLWQVLPRIGLEFRVRSFFPIFHLWDGEGLPFYDQLMIDGSVGLRFSIGRT